MTEALRSITLADVPGVDQVVNVKNCSNVTVGPSIHFTVKCDPTETTDQTHAPSSHPSSPSNQYTSTSASNHNHTPAPSPYTPSSSHTYTSSHSNTPSRSRYAPSTPSSHGYNQPVAPLPSNIPSAAASYTPYTDDSVYGDLPSSPNTESTCVSVTHL